MTSGAPEGWDARLERVLGAYRAPMRKARARTEEKRASVRLAFEGRIAADTNLVVFGSVAREGMTPRREAIVLNERLEHALRTSGGAALAMSHVRPESRIRPRPLCPKGDPNVRHSL